MSLALVIWVARYMGESWADRRPQPARRNFSRGKGSFAFLGDLQLPYSWLHQPRASSALTLVRLGLAIINFPTGEWPKV